MDFLANSEPLKEWLLQYGSLSLFMLLALGVIAFPIPDETLMVVAGILMKNGELPLVTTIIASYAGSMTGITVSYLLGRTAGSWLIDRYGKMIGLTEERLQKVHLWFEHYGKWTLTFGYFFPGLRHLTGFAAGISKLEFSTFAFFAYLGAAIWVTLFLSIGYFLGHYWAHVIALGEQYSDYTSLVLLLVAIALFLLWKKFKH